MQKHSRVKRRGAVTVPWKVGLHFNVRTEELFSYDYVGHIQLLESGWRHCPYICLIASYGYRRRLRSKPFQIVYFNSFPVDEGIGGNRKR